MSLQAGSIFFSCNDEPSVSLHSSKFFFDELQVFGTEVVVVGEREQFYLLGV